MPRTFTLVSISIHAIVIGTVWVAQTLNVGPLPLMRDAFAFADQTSLRSSSRTFPFHRGNDRPNHAGRSVSPGDAPLEAPGSVTPETGRETDISTTRSAMSVDWR